MSAAIKEETVQRWLDDEAERYAQRQSGRSGERPCLLLSPVAWVMPKLLRIVYQNTHQPIEAMAPLIRSMLEEQVFATTGGDPADSEWLEASMNESVGVIISVLQRVREHCLDKQAQTPPREVNPKRAMG